MRSRSKLITCTCIALTVATLLGCGRTEKRESSVGAPKSPPAAAADGATEHRKRAYEEATRMAGAIETGSKAQYQKETETESGMFVHRFCPSAKSPVPTNVPKGTKFRTTREWDAETWVCLKFAVSEPHYCQYDYESNGKDSANAAYVLTATCDPDGDGKLLKLELKGRGTLSGDTERVSLEVTGDPS